MWSKEDGDAMAEAVAKAARRAAPAVLVLAGVLFVAFLVIVVLHGSRNPRVIAAILSGRK